MILLEIILKVSYVDYIYKIYNVNFTILILYDCEHVNKYIVTLS